MSKVLTLGKRIKKLAEAYTDGNEVEVKLFSLDIDHDDQRMRFECIAFDKSQAEGDAPVALASGTSTSSVGAMRNLLTEMRKLIVEEIEESEGWVDELKLTLVADSESMNA